MNRRHLIQFATVFLVIGVLFTGGAVASEDGDGPPLLDDLGDKLKTVVVDYALKVGGPILAAVGAVGMFAFKSTNMVSRSRSALVAGCVATGIAVAWTGFTAFLEWFWL